MSQYMRRWEGGVAVAVALAAAGVWAESASLLLAAILPLVYLGYGALQTAAVPEGVTATRSIDPNPVPPRQPVEVEVTVHNGAGRPITDLRVVDPLPDELEVVGGSPRAGVALDAGETCELTYTVIARRGEYAFDPPRIRVREASAGAMATTTIDVAGDDTLDCRLDADAPPLVEHGEAYVGQLTADKPGRGVEFHSTRDYRTGDPASRIDWRHYAKQGRLATVNYEQRVSATVIVVVDARPPNYVVGGPGRPTAVELSCYAATRAVTDLLRAGNEVGVAILGMDGPGPAGLHWLPPEVSREQRSLALELFRTATDRSPDDRTQRSLYAPNVDEQVRKIADLAPPGSQLAVLSPLLDDDPVSAVETWHAMGLPQVVVSPDVLSANTVSGQFAQLRRHTRLAACQATGTRTIDWRRGTALPFVLERAFVAADKLGTAAPAPRTGGGR